MLSDRYKKYNVALVWLAGLVSDRQNKNLSKYWTVVKGFGYSGKKNRRDNTIYMNINFHCIHIDKLDFFIGGGGFFFL